MFILVAWYKQFFFHLLMYSKIKSSTGAGSSPDSTLTSSNTIGVEDNRNSIGVDSLRGGDDRFSINSRDRDRFAATPGRFDSDTRTDGRRSRPQEFGLFRPIRTDFVYSG